MLAAGVRLGSYEIVAPLGAGGMGEVYRARDLKLKRDVAIKVLPEAFADDSERLSRLQREAEALASLNHPNIAAIHQLDEIQGSRFLVLELVEGDTLAERIRLGPIPIHEALSISKQIAEALQAAHDKGLMHRDLKPANIKVTPDGSVKVLDFGLAKVYETQPVDPDLSQSPTLTNRTQPNVILGTAAYMSPEQARGHSVDRASDNWAFGCVLYEMLSGRQAFTGETITDILGGIVRVDPDWDALPEATPATIRSLLRRCLQKDRKRRLKDIADAGIEIDEILGELGKVQTDVPARPAASRSRGRDRLAWIVAGILLAASLVSVPPAVVHFREPAGEDRAIRFLVAAPDNATLAGTPPAISPDGSRLVFVASRDGRPRQLWIRPLDALIAQPLPGTEGADFPFWSPDSRSIAFFADGKLKKIDASSGPPQTLTDAGAGRAGDWNRDNVILFTPNSQGGPLHRVSSSGGVSTPVTTLLKGETVHRSISFLPDGRHFLFLVQGEKQGIYVGSLEGEDRKFLLDSDFVGRYAPPGYLLFLKERTLMAQRLDLRDFELAGEAFPIAEPMGAYLLYYPTFSVSNDGVLAYSAWSGGDRQLAWFDRAGKEIERVGPAMALYDVALSPDEKRAAMQVDANDIWVIDLGRGVPSKLTFGRSVEDFPVWSPDGNRILFNSTSSGLDLYSKLASGAGSEEPLFKSGTPKRPTDWRDGYILFENDDPKNKSDLWVLPLAGDRKPEIFLQTPFSEQQGRFSPDGKWVAYVSDESGSPQIYVQSFPPSGGKWQITTGGGLTPRWHRNGRELFYMAPDRKMMSVEVKASGTTFEPGSIKPLFEAPVDAVSLAATNRYEVSHDGQRFLINASAENYTLTPITVVVNWLTGAKGKR